MKSSKKLDNILALVFLAFSVIALVQFIFKDVDGFESLSFLNSYEITDCWGNKVKLWYFDVVSYVSNLRNVTADFTSGTFPSWPTWFDFGNPINGVKSICNILVLILNLILWLFRWGIIEPLVFVFGIFGFKVPDSVQYALVQIVSWSIPYVG